MALIHVAELIPSKRDLLAEWVPRQPWSGGADVEEIVGSFRFDDPADEVGIETVLVRAGGELLQVPVTFRDAPLDGEDAHLIGTAEHSVLGRRWCYDGCADPVYVAALLTAMLTGGGEAEEWVDRGGRREQREVTVRVRGNGAGGATLPPITGVATHEEGRLTVVSVRGSEVEVHRVLDSGPGSGAPGGVHTLTGTWSGPEAPALLAVLRDN